jgi:hypothetical protein
MFFPTRPRSWSRPDLAFYALSFLLSSPLFLTGNPQDQSYSQEEALKVLQAIDRVTAEGEQPAGGRLREVVITESELNSYIAFRIESEKEEIMKELRLKLLDKNKIEGKIHIDLHGQRIPQFIRPEMDIYFAASLRVSDGNVKIDIQQLFLEDQPIQLHLLDLIIAVSARLNNEKATSISDWYELPYGIKDIKTQAGKAAFYY